MYNFMQPGQGFVVAGKQDAGMVFQQAVDAVHPSTEGENVMSAVPWVDDLEPEALEILCVACRNGKIVGNCGGGDQPVH